MCVALSRPDAGEGEQVVDQHLHAFGAVDGEPDVFGAALVELVAVPLLQQLAEGGDLAQRLLQIVRRDIGELLEFGVGPAQLLGLFVQRRLAPTATPRVRRRSAAACPRRRPRWPGCLWGPRGTMRSPKFPSVIRRHAAASAASGRVTALRTSTASRTAMVTKAATIIATSTRSRQPRTCVELVDARRSRPASGARSGRRTAHADGRIRPCRARRCRGPRHSALPA